MTLNEVVGIDELKVESLTSDESTLESKPLPSSLKYVFLDV